MRVRLIVGADGCGGGYIEGKFDECMVEERENVK